jgi:hypothetical protein
MVKDVDLREVKKLETKIHKFEVPWGKKKD